MRLKEIQYTRLASLLLRGPSKLLIKLSLAVASKLKSQIKINGGNVVYYKYAIQYPKGVGIGHISHIFWHGEKGFEPSTGRTLIECFKACDTFIDVGSNFGFYSVLSKKVNPSLHVIAFEPNNLMASHNELFMHANKVEYLLVKEGLSDETIEKTLYVPEREGKKEIGTSSFKEDFFFTKESKKNGIKVMCTSLDHYWYGHLARANSKKVCIKIDVEGYELNVLKGSLRVLKEVRPVIICEVDNHQNNSKLVFQFMNELEYAIFFIQPLGLFRLENDDFNYRFGSTPDFVFIPFERLRKGPRNFLPFSELNLFT